MFFQISCVKDTVILSELNICIETAPKPKQNDINYLNYYNGYTLWKCHDIQNYKFRIFGTGQVSFFRSILITVRDGQVVDTDVKGPSPNFENYSFIPPTIDSYFRIIEQAVDEQIPLHEWLSKDSDDEVADYIGGEYDSIYGFPVDICIDYLDDWADEETRLRIEDFEIL